MSTSRANMTLKDYQNQGSQVTFRGEEIDETNFAEQMGLIDDLVTAVNGVSLCVVSKDIRIAYENIPGTGPAADPEAARESKWLVQMVDDVTGRAVQASIAGADSSLLLPNSDRMDPDNAAYIAIVAAIEAFHKSIGENAVSVLYITKVGRNL